VELKFEEPWLGTKSLSEELALAQLSVQMLERNFEELSWENSSALAEMSSLEQGWEGLGMIPILPHRMNRYRILH